MLCLRCRHLRAVAQRRNGEVVVYCRKLGKVIGLVLRCREYEPIEEREHGSEAEGTGTVDRGSF